MPARLHPRASTPYQIAQDSAAKAAICAAWETSGRRPALAAEALGVSRSTLYREIARLDCGADLPGYLSDTASVA